METNLNPVSFDSTLSVGMMVTARWTNCGSSFSALATVTKINGKSIVVSLNEEIDGVLGKYRHGQRITLPRLMGTGWSAKNCVGPVSL